MHIKVDITQMLIGGAVKAIFKDDDKESKNIQCDSLSSLAERLKGDRTTIRGYLKGERPGMYYRGK